MGLEALELVERRQRRILVVEMDDEADRDQPVVVMVEERAAGGAAAERPAETVLHQPGLELRRLDLPDLLQADAVFLRLAPVVELEAGDRLLGERAARAFGDQHVFAAQLHAAGEARLRLAVAADSHVAGRDADDFAVVAVKKFGRGEAGIDFDPERLGAAAHPARHRAERADELAVVAHQPRHQQIGQPHAARRPEQQEAIGRDFGLQRPLGIVAPVGQQPVEPDRIEDHAGEDMRADLRALLDHDHRHSGVELLEPDRRGQAGRAGADDDDVEFHRLARRQFVFSRHVPVSFRPGAGPARAAPKRRP